MKRLPWDLLAAAAVYLLVRGLILHTAFDSTALPMYELFPMGTMAELAREGVELPLSYYYDNAAGQILFGLVTRPFFALFGPSYLTLKCVTFALGLGVLVLVWSFVRANFGRRAAAIAAFLYALGPTTLVKYSLMHSGNHFENLFFSMAFLCAFYRFHRSENRLRWLFASGACAGFALFVFLGALIPIGLCAGVHLGARGLKRSLRDAPVALGGFALGILPLVLVNLATNARGLGFLEAKFAEDTPAAPSNVFARVWEFVSVHLFDSTVYESAAGVDPRVFGALFLVAFAAAYLASVPEALRGLATLARGLFGAGNDARERFQRAALVPFVLYLPFTALAYGVSNFRIGGHGPPVVIAGYRYFLPHLLFALILIAIVAARWWERGGSRRMLGASLAALPLVAGLSNFAIVDWSFSHAGLGSRYAGYNLAQVGRALIAGRNALTQEQIVAHLASFPPLLRHRVATSIGFNRGVLQIEEQRDRAAQPGADPSWRVDLARLAAEFPAELRIDLARGLGVAVRFSCAGPAGRAEIARVVGAAIEDDARLGACVAEGACLPPGTEPLESKSAAILGTNAALRDAIGERARPALMRGAGLFAGRLWVRGIESERPLLEDWMNAERDDADFWIGFGQGLADGGAQPRSPEFLSSRVDAQRYADACRGFGFGLARTRELVDAPSALTRYFERADGSAADALRRGMEWRDYPARAP